MRSPRQVTIRGAGKGGDKVVQGGEIGVRVLLGGVEHEGHERLVSRAGPGRPDADGGVDFVQDISCRRPQTHDVSQVNAVRLALARGVGLRQGKRLAALVQQRRTDLFAREGHVDAVVAILFLDAGHLRNRTHGRRRALSRRGGDEVSPISDGGLAHGWGQAGQLLLRADLEPDHVVQIIRAEDADHRQAPAVGIDHRGPIGAYK